MSIKSILEKNGLTPSAGASGPTGPTGPAEGDGASGATGADEIETGPSGASGPTGAEGETGATGPEAQSGASGPAASNEDDVDDEVFVRMFNKRKGTNFKTVEEINLAEAPKPTEEELQRQQAERQSNVRAFALSNKKVTAAEFDAYAQEANKDYKEIALDLYKAERIAALKAKGTPDSQLPEDSALEAEFDELNFLLEKDDDPKRQKAEARLKAEVDGYIQHKFNKIFSLEDEYDEHVTGSTLRQNYNTTVEQAFTKAAAELKTLTFDIAGDKPGEKVPYKFTVTPEFLQKVKANFTSDSSFSLFGRNNMNADLMFQAVKSALIQDGFEQILSEVANAHASAKVEAIKKGRRNIPDKESGSDNKAVVENATIKKILGKKENQSIINN